MRNASENNYRPSSLGPTQDQAGGTSWQGNPQATASSHSTFPHSTTHSSSITILSLSLSLNLLLAYTLRPSDKCPILYFTRQKITNLNCHIYPYNHYKFLTFLVFYVMILGKWSKFNYFLGLCIFSLGTLIRDRGSSIVYYLQYEENQMYFSGRPNWSH